VKALVREERDHTRFEKDCIVVNKLRHK